MSNGIKSVEFLRGFYKAQAGANTSKEDIRELREIKNELKVSNDLKAIELNNEVLTHSPYFTDQSYYNKEKIYNSERETDWKNVRSEEENLKAALALRTMKRLNIL